MADISSHAETTSGMSGRWMKAEGDEATAETRDVRQQIQQEGDLASMQGSRPRRATTPSYKMTDMGHQQCSRCYARPTVPASWSKGAIAQHPDAKFAALAGMQYTQEPAKDAYECHYSGSEALQNSPRWCLETWEAMKHKRHAMATVT